MLEIPLTSSGAQKFNTTLEGAVYEFFIKYNNRMQYWALSISTSGISIASGVVLVGGVDIVKQFTFELRHLYVLNIADPKSDATSTNLGTDVKLFKLTEEEVAQLG